jgi:hypothetical protein
MLQPRLPDFPVQHRLHAFGDIGGMHKKAALAEINGVLARAGI